MTAAIVDKATISFWKATQTNSKEKIMLMGHFVAATHTSIHDKDHFFNAAIKKTLNVPDLHEGCEYKNICSRTKRGRYL